jgi:hypothetical protein
MVISTDRARWPKRQTFGNVSGRCPVRISAGTQIIVTLRSFVVFLSAFKQTPWWELKFVGKYFRPHPFQFTIIQSFDVVQSEVPRASLNILQTKILEWVGHVEGNSWERFAMRPLIVSRGECEDNIKMNLGTTILSSSDKFQMIGFSEYGDKLRVLQVQKCYSSVQWIA